MVGRSVAIPPARPFDVGIDSAKRFWPIIKDLVRPYEPAQASSERRVKKPCPFLTGQTIERSDGSPLARGHVIGVGAGVADYLRYINQVECVDVNVATSATIEEQSLLHDQLWFGLQKVAQGRWDDPQAVNPCAQACE